MSRAIALKVVPTGELQGLGTFQVRFTADKDPQWLQAFTRSRLQLENEGCLFFMDGEVNLDVSDLCTELSRISNGEEGELTGYDPATRVVTVRVDGDSRSKRPFTVSSCAPASASAQQTPSTVNVKAKMRAYARAAVKNYCRYKTDTGRPYSVTEKGFWKPGMEMAVHDTVQIPGLRGLASEEVRAYIIK